VFAATEKLAFPFAFPVLPAVIVIHDELLTDVQLHPAVVVIETVAELADAFSDTILGVTLNWQALRELWVIVKVWPAIVIVPWRCVLPLFAFSV